MMASESDDRSECSDTNQSILKSIVSTRFSPITLHDKDSSQEGSYPALHRNNTR